MDSMSLRPFIEKGSPLPRPFATSSLRSWSLVLDGRYTVSKNGNLLLNVGPKPDGTLREQEVTTLREIGRWLSVNGEAIYGSRPRRKFGEGITFKIGEDGRSGKHKMGPDCVRFTVKNGVLYAIRFGWPDSGTFRIKSLSSESPVSKSGIRSIAMLGSDESIRWKETPHGLEVAFSKEEPCDYAYALKIVPNNDLLSQAPVSQPAIGPASDEAVPGGFVPLFSGINLDGWTVRSPENREIGRLSTESSTVIQTQDQVIGICGPPEAMVTSSSWQTGGSKRVPTSTRPPRSSFPMGRTRKTIPARKC
jgi:hypothetical protein